MTGVRVWKLLGGTDEDGEQVADPLHATEAIRKRKAGLDRVLVASSVALACDVAAVCELGDDPMRGAFGDSNSLADLSQEHTRVVGDAG